MFENVLVIIAIGIAVFLFGTIILVSRWYKKVSQGKALVRTGVGGLQVNLNGIIVIPVLHKVEEMDISIKSIMISRTGKEGLVCKDNMRADIKVVFFIRVNANKDDIKNVAQSIGINRASDAELLTNLFEAKFSEALKTVGKRFDFVQLYDAREDFKKEMLEVIGVELNGYILDSCAIDYLEQISIDHLDRHNILDSEGIKKITELTAEQNILANQIRRNEEKTITKQDVEAREAVLELQRQLAEKEEKQKREIANIKARENAETEKVQSEERMKSEKARIASEEEIQIAEENKQRQIIVAEKSKQKTEAIEAERVEKERQLQITEREKEVELARIAKEKALEIERKDIQGVIKERIMLEKDTVSEEEKIKDTRAFAEAERVKAVAIKNAEQRAEENLVEQIKSAEANKKAAELKAEQSKIEATALQETSGKNAEAKKILSEALIAEEAAQGLAEAQVMLAKSKALEQQGLVEANVIQKKNFAEAEGIKLKQTAENETFEERGKIEARILEQKGMAESKVIDTKADAFKKQGLAEAEVMSKKAEIEAVQIQAKADAMKNLDNVGIDHEEFKLRLKQETEIALAKINVQKEIAQVQAAAIAEALKVSKINIVGGETMFYENIMQAITRGQALDSFIDNSEALTQLKKNLLNGSENGGNSLVGRLREFIEKMAISTDDVKNLSISALILKMLGMANDKKSKGVLNGLLDLAQTTGIADKSASSIL